MKKTLARNIAIVSAIFVAVFSTMLIINYFQVSGSSPLQTEVIESLKLLNDDGANDPSAITRDYTLRLDDAGGAAPVLSVFGGKLTTYRRLAEHAL
ncbi:MAG: hypothetical protein LBE79_12250, partial [Tannerella sp.]|nr:hypothetical protein [Tannerella sp.]